MSGLTEPLALMQLEVPRLAPGQLLVKICHSGVCQTQLQEARGLRGPDPYLPHTMGHEGSGVVLDVGSGVKKVKPGDHVVLSWIKGMGGEVGSTVYQSSRGPVNSGAISTFMRHTVTCENRVTRVPDDMPSKEAALLGCAVLTGAGIVLNTARVRPGSSVAVFGVGGIGLSAILAANLANATTIIAVDVHQHKLEHARDAGATHLVNAREQDPLKAIMDVTGGKGLDYAFEAAGRREAMEAAFQSVHADGGLCVLAGNLPHRGHIDLDPYQLLMGKRIVGTRGGETQPDRDIPIFVNLFQSGRLKLGNLATRTYPLHHINQAMEDLENGAVGRALIDMSLPGGDAAK